VVALRTPHPLRMVKDVRHVVGAPLIVVTEGCSEDAHLELLDAGADWVIERPYSVRLFIGYARVLMRRADIVARESLPSLTYDVVRLDPSTRSVRVGLGPPQRLSQLEFRLLHSLMLHEGQVLPTETIVEHVWGYTGEGDRSLVRGLINRLRAKIEPNPNSPRYIRTVARVGYAFGMAEE
ncbi:MAG: response regulator transcription factor, partial [Caldilineaceae bacterium]|nr:response regulator transcription factor [Caldilineaceae bacterium]